MRSVYTKSDNDPFQRRVTCATCGAAVPLTRAHSIAVVYIGLDDAQRVRHSICDEDQPFACSQEHAIQAAHQYHLANHVRQRYVWQEEPKNPHLEWRLPDETSCHGCGAARTDAHIEVLLDYRCTGGARITPWHCPHLACPDCLPGIVETCAREHLTAHFQQHYAAKYQHQQEDEHAVDPRPAL